ncbi:DUF547 domain-containing protein/Lzipper-MIP1 domain-containing protein [Cephalotus follicularis]|uniref:DUF547 domain-containing protein/Lzipper-MIP1 domain-containing protein n=1 Tax=Cephalotus follicularis TaxID=3775 RepID=A0A1Q3BGM2_CEPFO|nr:DUF547 domain-containing protein/Lzipper-MIP1 domain-containing protein [Cephalotus follicularis]
MGQLKGGCVEAKKRQLPSIEAQTSLKQEILQLQKRLHDQCAIRRAMEKALSYRPFSFDTINDKSIPKAAKDLIREIAVLEMEVVYLEKYLLSLYREKFNQKISPPSGINGRLNSTSNTHKGLFPEVLEHDISSEKENVFNQSGHLLPSRNSIGYPAKECNDTWGKRKLLDPGIHHSSSLTQYSVFGIETSPPMKALAKAVDSYHSLPLSMLERAHCDTSNVMSLADHFGSGTFNHVPETPNWLSEEMIKCISAIYCELADPPLISHDYPSSPLSYSSSMDAFSSKGQDDMCSPQRGKFSSFNSHFDNPFHIGASMEFSGPYCTMAKVQWICRDSQKLKDIEHKLQKYRSLVRQLEEADPRRMQHEQKLAFWINVHNALVMHAFLVNGIPQNNLKRMSLLLKAAYNIGGHTVSVDMIQNIILRCRLPHPAQWLKLLFPSKTKFKIGDARRAYVIEHPEPRLYFALCSGSQSDPAIRLYTPKRVFQDLEGAKEEYIQSNFTLNKEQKLLLPKIVETFAKDSDLHPVALMEMIEHLMPDSLRKNIQRHRHKKIGKIIEWIPHNFAFCYLLSTESAN